MLYHADVYLGNKRMARVSGLNYEFGPDARNKAIELARWAMGFDRTHDLKVQLIEFRQQDKWLKGWPRLSPTGYGMEFARQKGLLPRDIHELAKLKLDDNQIAAIETPTKRKQEVPW